MRTTAASPLSIPDRAQPLRPAPAPDGEAERLIADRLGAEPAHRAPESGRGVLVWGSSPGFLGIAEDVARAARMSLRTADAEHPPLCGPEDVLLVQADDVPGLNELLTGPAAPPEPRRPAVIAGISGGADPWAAAHRIGAVWRQPDVVLLPQGRAWLADHLAQEGATEPGHPRIGVLGASGGIGASALSLWLAARLREDGREPVVVDAVAASIGLDSCLSARSLDGLRWQQLEALPRRPEPTRLLASLPAPQGIPVLTADPAHPGFGTRPDAGRWSVVDALGTVALPVIDLGSAAAMVPPGGLETQWVSRCSVLVLLVPFTLRGICQAQSAMRRWAPVLPIVPVGAGPRVCDVSDAEVAEILGAPLAAVLPHVPAVYAAYDDGALLEVSRRRGLRRPVAAVADAALAAAEAPGGSEAGPVLVRRSLEVGA